jgi:cell division protein ZapA (FtsZ GTPase activity inhibitor)
MGPAEPDDPDDDDKLILVLAALNLMMDLRILTRLTNQVSFLPL